MKNAFKKLIDKWKNKKKLDKIGDIFFIVFLVILIIPTTRNNFIVQFKRVTSFQAKELKKSEIVSVEEDSFYWELINLQGQNVNLMDYQGKTLFINHWATWCPPCVAEMPSIEKLYNEFENDEEVAFFMVTNEDLSIAKKFLNEKSLNMPVFRSNSNVPPFLFTRSIPTTFIISPKGEIVLNEVGSKKWHGQDTIDFINSLK